MLPVSRRTMLSAFATALLAGRNAASFGAPWSADFQVDEIKTISLQSDRYHGWPTLIRRKNGELLVVCSGGRHSHVCPFGRVELIKSFDDGATWTYARTLLDGPIDDRDAGILETAKGTLLVTTFTSLAYEPGLQKAIAGAEQGKASMPPEQLARWQAAHARLP